MLLLAGCVAALVTACGPAPHARITVRIAIRSYDATTHKPVDRSWMLRCRPTGGDMPLATRLCADIARHPVAMLAPGRARSVCGGMVFGPAVTVSSERGQFSGEPGCNWPGGTALVVYWAASRGDRHALDNAEPRLRCDEDPRLVARHPPWSMVVACVHGRWTPRTERMIRLARQALPLRASFPTDVGTAPCAIGARGICGVDVTHLWAAPRVTFAEQWGATTRHRRRWVVTIAHGVARVTSEG
jgi:hypothetical protein